MKQWRDLKNIFSWRSDRDLFADEFDPRKSWRRLLIIFFVGLVGLSILNIGLYYSWFSEQEDESGGGSATSTVNASTISKAAGLINMRLEKFESASISEVKLPDPAI